MAKTILILGASWAGLAIAHKLLKTTLKGLKGQYKVVIVSPTTHFYMNLASVRAIVPGQFTDEKVFASIPDGLKQYGTAVEFILGAATALDPTNKTITISSFDKERKQNYDILVIATGSRATSDDLPWKSSNGGYESTKAALHKVQEQVKKANSIVIGGGGPTGCESAGELGFEYGLGKEITLITSGSQLLSDLPGHVASFAERELKKLHVNIVKDVKILSSAPTADGKTTLALSNGEEMTVDLYLPTIGVLPNTEFLPKSLLDGKAELIVDHFLRVKGVNDVWAVGDATNLQSSQITHAQAQAAHLVKNLELTLNGKEPAAYRTDTTPAIGVTLGRSKGTGRSGNIRIPSLVIWYLKGRTMGTDGLQAFVNGK